MSQSVHFIYGPQPPAAFPTLGTATFDFLGGTQSTSLGGSTIGQGVTGGSISFNFATDFGSLNMDVNHNNTQYAVTADLYASTCPTCGTSSTVVDIIVGGGNADTATPSSYCDGSCGVSILGNFAGATSDGNPQFINLHYQVDEADPFIGVASFKFSSIAVPSSTVMPIGGLTAVFPDPSKSDLIGTGSGTNVSAFLNNSSQIIGLLLTTQDSTSPQREIHTFDLSSMLGGNDATAVAEVQSIYNSSPNAPSLATAVASNPASVGEYFYDSTKGVGWGRWTNGNVLNVEGTTTNASIISLSGTQSLHFIFADALTDINGLTTTATYSFMGGTQSSSTSSIEPLGSGVTSGTILVNFGLSDADINMMVNHGINYNVSGILYVDPTDSSIYDAVAGDVTASSSSSTCNPCNVSIDGGFVGSASASGGPAAVPGYVGIKYAIQEANPVMGVAGFQYSGP